MFGGVRPLSAERATRMMPMNMIGSSSAQAKP